MKKDNFYSNIYGLQLEHTCVNISSTEWDKLMKGAKKANYTKIHRLIKKLAPEYTWLTEKNPYKYQYSKTKTHLIVVHSAIEYFFRITN